MADVHGFCDERFRPMEDAFRANLDSDVDKGASLAVTLHGDPVLDLWGGTRDYEMALPWEADTVVRVFSTSKVIGGVVRPMCFLSIIMNPRSC